MFKPTLLALLTMLSLAAAQEIQPVPAMPTGASAPLEVEPASQTNPVKTGPATVLPMPAQPVPMQPAAAQLAPVQLSGVNAELSAPRTSGTRLTLKLTLSSKLAQGQKLEARRENQQDCAVAPLVRVLKVGSRAVVYPPTGLSLKICTQDIRTGTLTAGGTLNYSRELELPAGEYMIEGWWQGLASGVSAKASAQPVRVTVK